MKSHCEKNTMYRQQNQFNKNKVMAILTPGNLISGKAKDGAEGQGVRSGGRTHARCMLYSGPPWVTALALWVFARALKAESLAGPGGTTMFGRASVSRTAPHRPPGPRCLQRQWGILTFPRGGTELRTGEGSLPVLVSGASVGFGVRRTSRPMAPGGGRGVHSQGHSADPGTARNEEGLQCCLSSQL